MRLEFLREKNEGMENEGKEYLGSCEMTIDYLGVDRSAGTRKEAFRCWPGCGVFYNEFDKND